MNQTLRDTFARELDDAGRLDVDIQALVDKGETRLRRRRLTAVLGAAAAVVVALAVGAATLNGTGTPRPAPIDRPSPREETPPTRQVVYSDHKIGVGGHAVHFGDRVVETGNDYVHLDVTDDGFLYTDRGGVWFSEGGTPVRVGSHLCGASRNGEFAHFANRAVVAANSGSTVAWFDCTHPARPALVVFDTSSHHEVVRRPVPFCRGFCEVGDVTSDYVYFNRGFYSGEHSPEYRFDLRANRLRASTPREYADDLRAHPRGLILGDDWQSGTPITGDGLSPTTDPLRFAAVGSRLLPVVSVNDRDQVTSAFDTATRRVLRLRLPAGYHVETTDSFSIFEWLDDETVALLGGRADILTCQLSTGHCVVAVQGPDADTWRIVPEFPLPG
jgi:hypothetical protein